MPRFSFLFIFLFLFSLGDRSGNKGKRNRPVSRFAAVDRTCAFRSCYTLFTPYYPGNDFRAGARLTHHGVFHHFSFLSFFFPFPIIYLSFSSLFARRRKTALTHRLIRYLLPRVHCPFRFSLAYLRAPRRRPPNVAVARIKMLSDASAISGRSAALSRDCGGVDATERV